MLTVSFATRTDSTSDPLVERALSLVTEFMDLSGISFSHYLSRSNPLTSDHSRTIIEHCRLHRATPVDPDHHEIACPSDS